MATVSDGQNPGRSATPQRQSPSPARSGRGGDGLDPTAEHGQTPAEIFGFPLNYSTGAQGSQGASGTEADVTVEHGQLGPDHLTGLSREEITSTGLHGSQGASPHAGGESVRYTDPFGYQGNEHRTTVVSGATSGADDWTLFGDGNGFAGPTLPGLEGNRPTDTGASSGHVRGPGNPNAMGGGSQPHPAGNPNAGR